MDRLMEELAREAERARRAHRECPCPETEYVKEVAERKLHMELRRRKGKR